MSSHRNAFQSLLTSSPRLILPFGSPNVDVAGECLLGPLAALLLLFGLDVGYVGLKCWNSDVSANADSLSRVNAEWVKFDSSRYYTVS